MLAIFGLSPLEEWSALLPDKFYIITVREGA